MTDRVPRYAIDVGGRTVGYRRAGAGAPVLVLGSIAHATATLLPLLRVLAQQHTVLAVDPPGHGLSDPLPGAGVPELADAVAATLQALGWERPTVVGVHSGGLVALELTRRDLVGPVVLDDVPVLDAATRAECAQRYTPVAELRADGSHLVTQWAVQRAEHLWFPWFEQRPDAALDLDLTDVEPLHTALMDRLRAGEQVGDAYAAVWRHELVPVAGVVALTPSTPRLGCPVPDPAPAGREPAERRDVLTRLVGEVATGTAPAPVDARRVTGRWQRHVASTPWGQVAVRARWHPTSSEPPLVLLHASPLSGLSLVELAGHFSAHRSVVLPDTLGYGDSDPTDPLEHPEFHAPQVAQFADVLEAALDALGLGAVDVYGTHSGAVLALELAARYPARVQRLVFAGVPLFDPADVAVALETYFVDLAPRWDGGHLLAAWAQAVDTLTWYPWHDRRPAARRAVAQPDAAVLHTRCVQILAGARDHGAHRAVWVHPTRARAADVRARTLVGCAASDPLAPYVRDLAATMPAADLAELTGSVADDAATVTRWLDRTPVTPGGEVA